jgi:hypothetical protein
MTALTVPAIVTTTVPGAASATAPQPQLGQQLGQVITGLVVAQTADMTLRVQTAAGTFDAKADAKLAPGTAVAISVQGTARQPELVVTPIAGGSDRPGAQGSQRADILSDPQFQSGTNASPSSAASPTPANAAEADAAEFAARPGVTTPASAIMQAALSAATAIVRGAAASQGGLAALYANLETIVAAPAATTPQPVLAAATQMLAMRFDIASGDAIGAGDIKAALMRAGLVAEPVAAGGLPPGAAATNVGAALIVLRRALSDWRDMKPDLNAVSEPQQNLAAAPPTTRPATPMPPYRGAPTVPQAPSPASIQAAATPREQAIHLLNQTDAAIARQTLLHIASLPGEQTNGTARTQNDSSRLIFDIPVATAQGTGVAQMAIERDGGSRDRQDIAPVWRATFSIDLEPIGPVHVRIALTGQRASVTLNAERSRSAEFLAAGLPRLEAGLRGVEIEPGELHCRSGAAPAPLAMPGAFVDRAT